MAKLAAIAAQVKSVCDFLHQYEGLETRQLRRMQTTGFYNAFAKSILAVRRSPTRRLVLMNHRDYCPSCAKAARKGALDT